MGFQQYVKDWNQSTQVITFTNDSQILFMAESYDTDKELNRFRGLEINGAGIDEINEIQIETFYKVIERAGSWSNAGTVPIKVLGTCNPSHGWVKEEFYDRYKQGTLRQGWAYVPALITDNPYITKEYLKSLTDNMPEYQYQVFVEGNWDVKLEGVLFDKKDLKRYKRDDLNESLAVATLGYADIADEGDDFFSLPMAKIFPKKIFITDIIFTKENVDVTLPMTAELMKRKGANYIRVESNNQGSVFIKMLRDLVALEKVLQVNNHTNKHTRILLEYGFIIQYVYFLDESQYAQGSAYDLFMRQLLSYMKDGTSPHDDAADSLSGLAKLIQTFCSDLFQP
jgi:predicted phage terminase large subunit-like protein